MAQKSVYIASGTGAPGIPQINVTGASGPYPQWTQLNQPTFSLGPTGSFPTIQCINPSGLSGGQETKTVFIPNYTPFPLPFGPTIDMDFVDQQYLGASIAGLTVSRASAGTNLLPTSPAGMTYTTFANNVARITPGLGLLIEESRVNVLFNSTAPATQTTQSLGTGTYTLWVNGTGSATSSAGSATITGAGTATQGNPNIFVVTVAGTVTITVAGSLSAFQCELNPGTVGLGTSLIATTGATGSRAGDNIKLTGITTGGPMSIYGSVVFQAPYVYTNNQFVAEFSDGTLNNRSGLIHSTTGFLSFTDTVGGVAKVFPAGITGNSGVFYKFATAVPAGPTATMFSNIIGTANSVSTVGPTGMSVLAIGQRGDTTATFPLNGYLERVALWPTTSLTAAQLALLCGGTGTNP